MWTFIKLCLICIIGINRLKDKFHRNKFCPVQKSIRRSGNGCGRRIIRGKTICLPSVKRRLSYIQKDNNRCQVMAIAHMTFLVRWAKKDWSNMLFFYRLNMTTLTHSYHNTTAKISCQKLVRAYLRLSTNWNRRSWCLFLFLGLLCAITLILFEKCIL
jgi:hypothetical protein